MGISMFDLIILVSYLVIIGLIGVFCMKKVTSFSDYAVAGRNITMALIFATTAATCIGGGATTGRVSFAYESGIVIAFIGIAAVFNHVISGWFIAPKIRKMENVYTAGDIMGFYYGKSSRFVTGIITFLFCAAMFGSQILAMGNIISVMTGLPLIPVIIVASIFTIIYTWAGGMYAVIYTDVIQFIILTFGITLSSVMCVNNVGGLDALFTSLPETNFKIVGAVPTSTFVTLAVSYMFGEFLAPYFINRYASAKDVKSAKYGPLCFGIFYFFFEVVVCMLGLVGAVTLPGIEPDAVMSTVIKDTLPVGIIGLVYAALISSIMSSGDSILNTAAVIFSRDIYKKFINNKATDRQMLMLSKVGTIVIGVVGVFVAVNATGVFDAMMKLYGYWAPSLVPPLAVAIIYGGALERKISPYAGLGGISAGLITKIIWDNLQVPYGIPSIIVGITCNLFVMFIIHNVMRNKEGIGMFRPEELTE